LNVSLDWGGLLGRLEESVYFSRDFVLQVWRKKH